MNIDTFKDNIPKQLEVIEGVEAAYINDYNSKTVEIIIDMDRKAVKNDLRATSGKIKTMLRKMGFSAKKGTLLEWIAPIKKRDQWGQLIVENSSYYINMAYLYVDLLLPVDDYFKKELYVFDKYDFVGISDNKLKDIFMKTFETSSNQDEHFEKIERRLPNYNIYPLWKYEHSGINYELSQSCRFDSSLIGCIAIKEDSELTHSEVIQDMNLSLNEDVA